ncbi:MAG: DUF4139 domain-containing protein [Vicingus serpentipes]|nr:DUF4139 domain-containing protein [Vicingus serpentipes]
MKKITSLFVFGCMLSIGFSQNEKIQEVETTISSAIIYLNGAEIHRSKKVTLVKGRNQIMFTGLSPKLDEKSIQVTTTNNVALLAVSHQTDYLTDVKEKPRVKQLKDSLTLITQKNVFHQNNRDAYSIEKDMLQKNKSIGGTDKGVSITELKMAADFYRLRVMEINKAISKIDEEVNENTKTINRINNELYQLNAKLSYTRGVITLLLNSDAPTVTSIDLKYIVTNAGWAPSYDIRARDINEPIDIVYRAKVYNNTDIDWQNIKFKLSTGDPTVSATQPKLTPWYLNYKTSQVSISKANYGRKREVGQTLTSSEVPSQDFNINQGLVQNQIFQADKVVFKPEEYTQIAVSELSAEFDIEKEYSIPSDNKPYIVDVTTYNVPALFKHYSVPKLDRDAFLIARIPNWQDLNLIEGNANIYFGGTFVGQSFISTRSVSDTLDVSLGRDKKVIVTRTKMQDFSAKKLIGTSRKETHAYRMIVKNNRKTPINIEVLGQVPVSQDSEIEVGVDEISGATKNDLTGELRWMFQIDANQNKTIDLIFSVKYPKNKPVNMKKEVYQSIRFL